MSDLPAPDPVGPAARAALDRAERRARWMGPVFAALAVVLVPWTVYLGLTLPPRETAAHYAFSWAGFDVGLVLGLAAVAWAAWRGSRWLTMAATVTATMLLVDAWFDVTTASTRSDQVVALVSALALELPLSAACFWLAVNGQRIVERQIIIRVRRRAAL